MAVYYTFPLSYRDVERMMLYRRSDVTYEAIRYWCRKFAQAYANQLRRRRLKPADKWQPCGFVKRQKSPLKLLGKEKQPLSSPKKAIGSFQAFSLTISHS